MPLLSGQITVSTAGTEVLGPDTGPGDFLIKFDSGNTGATVYVGNDGNGAVSSTTGFKLNSGDQCILSVKNLNTVYFDVATSGDKIDWLRISPLRLFVDQ
jgi:hypothetical protein